MHDNPPETDYQHEPERWFRIVYECPECGYEWSEEWSCACDSECPNCHTGDITAKDWEEIERD